MKYLLLALTLVSCNPDKGPCGYNQLNVIVARCTALAYECRGKGLTEEQCPATKECDKLLDEWVVCQ